jgi:hypothetical protein
MNEQEIPSGFSYRFPISSIQGRMVPGREIATDFALSYLK